MEILHAPTVGDEFRGQPIQECLMLGLGPLVPEIKDTCHERFTEMTIPNVVDRDARGQWILRIGDPSSQSRSTP